MGGKLTLPAHPLQSGGPREAPPTGSGHPRQRRNRCPDLGGAPVRDPATDDVMSSLPPRSEMERAVVARDAAYDGTFLAVRTAPPHLLPPILPGAEAASGEHGLLHHRTGGPGAGFRPCLRCRPLDTDGEPPDWVDELLELVTRSPETRLRDADLKRRGIDPALCPPLLPAALRPHLPGLLPETPDRSGAGGATRRGRAGRSRARKRFRIP